MCDLLQSMALYRESDVEVAIFEQFVEERQVLTWLLFLPMAFLPAAPSQGPTRHLLSLLPSCFASVL